MAPRPKSPPNSVESEQALLGSILLENRAFYSASLHIGAEDFYRHDHAAIWRAIAEMMKAGQPVDLVTLPEHAKQRGTLESMGGFPYIGDLMDGAGSPGNAESYALTIRNKSQLRRVIAFAGELTESAYGIGEGEELMAKAGTALATLLRAATPASKEFVDCVESARAAMLLARKRRLEGGQSGAPSGLPAMDELTGGFSGPRLVVLAARPGAGKTALLNQFATHAVQRGYPGLICSIEMSADELTMRNAALYSGHSLSAIMRGHDQGDEAFNRLSDLSGIPLWVDDETTSLDSLCAQISLHRHRHGIQWAAIDHIGLIKTERFQSRNDQMGHISWTLKQLAKRLNMPVIALSQLSRLSERETRRPRADDLRDSGNIEQDADIIIMLHTPQDKRGERIRPVEIGIVKNRCGPSVWLDERFEFCGRTQAFRQVGDFAPPPNSRGEW